MPWHPQLFTTTIVPFESMNRREVIKDVFATKAWIWIVPPLLVAFLVGQAAMYSRSVTLREVRSIDVEYTTVLVEAALAKNTDQSQVANLNKILNALSVKEAPETHMGIAIWLNGQQKEENHPMLKDKSVADVQQLIAGGDARYSIRKLRPNQPNQQLELAFFRPEMGHDMGVGHFLWLSFFQLADEHSREVTGAKFIERLWLLWLLTGLITLAVMFVARYVFRYHHRKMQEKIESAHRDFETLEEKRKDNVGLQRLAEDELRKEEQAHEKLKNEHARQLQRIKKADKLQRSADHELQQYKNDAESLASIKRELEQKHDEIELLKQSEKERKDAAYEIEKEQRQKLLHINQLENEDLLSQGKNTTVDEWRWFFTRCFPHFTFKSSSFDVLEKFLANAQYNNDLELLVKYLSRLHSDRDKLQSKKLHGGTDAKEIKLTGSGHGNFPLRIYYCETANEIFVMIGHKARQNDDIRYLKQNFRSRK